MKKIITKLNKKSAKNYLKIETTGLSKIKDTIITLSVIEKDRDYITTLVADDLKSEEKIIEFIKNNLNKKTYITFNASSFDGPFIDEKSSFYFGKNLELEFIDLQKLSKSYNYIFNLNSYSNKNLLSFFDIKESDIKGKDVSKLYKDYLLGDKKSLDKIVKFATNNINNLFLLDEKLENFIKEKMTININKNKFLIKSITLNKNNLKIIGKTNFFKNIFITNENYTLNIDKDFTLEINAEDLPYDDINSCYFVRKSKFGNLKNKSKIKSPSGILILYYKNYLFDNIVELLRFIISKSI